MKPAELPTFGDRRPRVYFARCRGMVGPIKIGFTIAPEMRVKTLSTWAPFPVELIVSIPGGLELERRVHRRFAHLHSHREWFEAGADLLGFIARLLDGVPAHDAIDLDAATGEIRTKRSWTGRARKRASYASRLRHAVERAQADAGLRLYSPADADAIITRWQQNKDPSSAEIARLEEVIGDPGAHCVSGAIRWPHETRRPFAPAEAGSAA